jgi:long-subunit acyl-CoA synthetase (AMP-forming)
MNQTRIWHSDKPLQPYLQNLAVMLNRNADRFGNRPMFQQVRDGAYQPLSWQQLRRDIVKLQLALRSYGLNPQDRVAILSPNRREMLEFELAVMAMGAIAVPIFAGYPAANARALVDFCRPTMVAVADDTQYAKLESPGSFRKIIHFDKLSCNTASNHVSFEHILKDSNTDERIADEGMSSDAVCLMMYTSGTMGKPKCVQLTHGNILSQQAAMHVLWSLNENDRFLSYLPWHHSFGGIYEKYAALCNGAVLSLEHGYGKDIDLLIQNWRHVKPTVFFSVPRIYQQIITLVMQDKQIEQDIFHDELRFIFTAAAPLPKSISDIFEQRNVPVYEGWGLTETSPCCTVTDTAISREPGVVGKPIPGVSLKLSSDGEILVQGPNVMTGYFDNPEATADVLSKDGWFATGDVGEFTDAGLRLISRKDRIFKLSNAEKVVSTEVENLIVQDCCFLSHAFLAGNGKDHPVVLLFPNKALLESPPDGSKLKPGCECPTGLKDLSYCLTHCLKKLNETIDPKFARPQAAMLIDHELSIEEEELTPSMKLAPNVVGRLFKGKIERLYGSKDKGKSEDVFILDLED